MDPLKPKPFTPVRPSTLKSFHPRQNTEMIKNAQTLPVGMPGLSGDILKQKLATMTHKPSSENMETSNQKSNLNEKHKGQSLPRSTGSPKLKTQPPSVPVLTPKVIQNRRDSMHKAPPPPTPDSVKQKLDKTPEFLRKKLKPTGKALKADENTKEDISNDDQKHEENQIVKNTSDFRNSKLMFEQFTAAPPIAPKPRSKSTQSFKSMTDNVNANENKDLNKDIESMRASPPEKPLRSVCNMKEKNIAEEVIAPEEPGQYDINREVEQPKKLEQWPKPPNVRLPEVPHKLSEWIRIYVVNNKDLLIITKEEQEENISVSPLMQDNLKTVDTSADYVQDEIYDDVKEADAAIISVNMQDQTNSSSRENIGEEIYDDVDNTEAPSKDDGLEEKEKLHDVGHSGAIGEEIYDDVTEHSQPVEEEIYDDVNETSKPAIQEVHDDIAGDTQAAGQEIYDDVTDGTQPEGQEIYDDIAGESQPGAQEIYDDIETHQQSSMQTNEEAFEEGNDGEDLYEPVETITQYMTTENLKKSTLTRNESCQSNQNNDKANKKREEKERKEREKLEKKRRDEAEKKLKKDEEERKRKEKEERRKMERERKSFNLKPDEDPVPIERYRTSCDCKGKNKDLYFSKGEYVDIITKNNCPKGKWLAQNSSGKLGYVQTNHLDIDKRKSLLNPTSPVAIGVAFGGELYEEVTSQSVFSIASIQSSDPNMSSPTTLMHFKPAVNSTSLDAQSADVVEEDANAAGEEIYELIS